MLRVVRLFALGVVTATVLLAALPAGVGAVVNAADYAVWRSTDKPVVGIGTIWDDTDIVRLRAEYLGLDANRSYRLVISSVRCRHAHHDSDTLLSRSFESNSQGAAFYKVEFTDIVISSIKSARVFRGSTQVDCARALGYQSGSGGPLQPTEWLALTIVNKPDVHFIAVIERFSGQETFTYAVHGLMPSEEYVLRATNATCPDQPAAIKLENVYVTSVKGTKFQHDTEANVADGRIRSVQLFHGSDRIACGRTITIDPRNNDPG